MDEKTVLIIDDEFPVRYLVEHHLQRRGFRVSAAKDGPSGIRAAFMEPPDVIVLDAMMPDMDGYEVCAELRGHPATAQIPIIFLTALGTGQHRTRALELGADDYLTKPFAADELIAHIHAVLAQRAERAQRADLPEAETVVASARPQVVAFYSPKGGVGTTTLAIELGQTVARQPDQAAVLLDLNLPLGGVAPALGLQVQRHVLEMLSQPPDALTQARIADCSQLLQPGLWMIPAPGRFVEARLTPSPDTFARLLALLKESGRHVVMDLGSNLNRLTLAALRAADVIYLVSSGTAVANQLCNSFLAATERLGLEPPRIQPVLNAMSPPEEESELPLSRLPVAHLPSLAPSSDTGLWHHQQGMQKLAAALMPA